MFPWFCFRIFNRFFVFLLIFILWLYSFPRWISQISSFELSPGNPRSFFVILLSAVLSCKMFSVAPVSSISRNHTYLYKRGGNFAVWVCHYPVSWCDRRIIFILLLKMWFFLKPELLKYIYLAVKNTIWKFIFSRFMARMVQVFCTLYYWEGDLLH